MQANLLEDFLKSEPESDRAWETLGQAYTNLGRFNKAADAYKHAVELNPDDADLLKIYAQTLFFDNQLPAATAAYEKLLEADGNDASVLLRLGQIYRTQMQYEDARRVLQKASDLSANNIEIDYEFALLDREDGQLDDAVRRFADVLKKTERPNGQYTDAELRNRRILTTYLGLTNSSLGRYDDAVKAFTELKAISTDKGSVDAYIVDVYRSAKNADKALDYVQTAMKESPESRDLQIVYAEVLGDKGRVDDGIKALQKLSNGTEDDFNVMSTMAGIYERSKKFVEAQSIIDSALKRFPDDERVYFIQGALFEKQNKVADAERAFRKAIELDANNAPALNYLGYMLADRNLKLDEALTLIKKAVDLDRAQGAYLDSLGWVYFRLNDLNSAEQFLKKAVLFVSTDSDVHDHLGELYFKQGRYEDARTEWTKSLQLAEDQEDAQKIRKKLDDVRNKIAKK
jgi:tetratricopeptide (TPR) repeat protein